MHKLLILLIIPFVLCSCGFSDISDSLFIASVGFERAEDSEGYIGYFYLPLSSDIGKSENMESKGQGEFVKAKGKNITEIFNNAESSDSLDINLRHLSSVILDEELLNTDFLNELVDYVKFSFDIDFNWYLFATKEKISDIYSFKKPNKESVLNSILVSTGDYQSIYLVATPMHFLEFVRKYFSNRNIILPMIMLEEMWTIDGKESKSIHPQSAIYYYRGKTQEVVNNYSSPYMKDNLTFYDEIKKVSIHFTNYKLRLSFEDKLLINLSFGYELYKSDSDITKKDIEEFISKKIANYILEYKEIDPLDLKYYNYVFNKNVNYNNYEINFNIEKN